ncbi:MAG: hypothetical protein RL582_1526 [Bacteroidota bacterium]|jgi:hypothetical protein
MKIIDKFFVKQWTIGIAKGNKEDILQNRLKSLDFSWITLSNPEVFVADPFVIELPSGEFHVIAELIYQSSYGKLACYRFSKTLELLEQKIIFDSGSHLSYPFILEDNGEIFIIPESAMANGVFAYPYDPIHMSLGKPITLIEDEPLLDSTFVYYEDRWWLFATKRGVSSNSALHIYHAEHWKGPYEPHKLNPVKTGADGSRPAGNILKQGNHLLRPAQNCKESYGKSITLFKITKLNKVSFEEVPTLEIKADIHKKNKYGIHTINQTGSVIVVDCLKKSFNPFIQIKLLLKKLNKKRT